MPSLCLQGHCVFQLDLEPRKCIEVRLVIENIGPCPKARGSRICKILQMAPDLVHPKSIVVYSCCCLMSGQVSGEFFPPQGQSRVTFHLQDALAARCIDAVFIDVAGFPVRQWLCRIYGFYDECKSRYNIKIWKTFCDLVWSQHMCLPSV